MTAGQLKQMSDGLIERGSGLIHIHYMSAPPAIECAMCPAVGDWLHCVPYYCGPVAEGCSEGGYRAVCPACHNRWTRWNDSLNYYGA